MTTEFFRANSGVNFDADSGKLYVFESDRITVAVSWPKPVAWQKTPSRGWRNIRLNNRLFQLPRLDLASEIRRLKLGADEDWQIRFPFMIDRWEKNDLARYQWYFQIPAETRALLYDFCSRQWHLLAMLTRCGSPAYDLVSSSPALAFALASNWVFHKPAVQRPLRSIRCLLGPGKKQKDILNWLGFPATNSARKILAKVNVSAVEINPMLYLRQAMRHPEPMKLLSHVPRLNRGVLRIITDDRLRPLTSPRFLEEVSLDRRENRIPESSNTIQDSLVLFDRVRPNDRFPVLRSLADLHRLHNELIHDYNLLPVRNLRFPQPPLPGTDAIVPIPDPHGLWEEGVEMSHCVSGYSDAIAHGKGLFVYKVLAPERCTLSIRKSGSFWRIGELKGSHNRLVSPETVQLVNSWLANRQQGVRTSKVVA